MLYRIGVNMNYNIGDRIKDDKRDITITDMRRRNGRLEYKYTCNICGYDCGPSYRDGIWKEEYWLDASHLKYGKTGCSCCQGRAVIPGVNNVGHTNKELSKFIKNEEDKLRFTQGSKRKIEFTCPDCKLSFKASLDHVSADGFKCPFCSDNMPLGEKIIYSLLSILNIDFIKEYSSSNSDWTGRYRYDFFIPPNIIIEVMGSQHSGGTFEGIGGRTLYEEQVNDEFKKELAIQNGISKYIVIDSRFSDFDYIKNNIINSELSTLFDLSQINWQYINELTTKSLIKEICDYWNEHEDVSTGMLKNKFKLSYTVIQQYLKQVAKLGWCIYDPQNYRRKNIFKDDTVNTSTPIKCIENNKYFKSVGLCSRKSINAFGIQLDLCSIRSVLSGKYTHHRGYHFVYVTKEEFNKAIDNNLECYGSPFCIEYTK